MTHLHYALTLGIFAGLLLWLGWIERKNDNARDGKLLFFSGTLVAALSLAVVGFE